jgi:predicted nucleic acid-binding protein
MLRPLTAIYDANVLYPAPLRDLLVRLAAAGLVRARWTDAIHEEWIRNVCRNNPGIVPERLARTRRLMNEAVRDCLVTGYEHLIGTLTLPDADDRHVLAAAIQANADVIVTFNLRDFPESALSVFGIQSQHPDEFVGESLRHSCDAVCAIINRQRASLHNPPLEPDELLDVLEKQGLTQSVARLRQYRNVL